MPETDDIGVLHGAHDMTDPELSPCPKCGGVGKLTSVNRGRWKAVRCLNPRCKYQTKGCTSYDEARKKWDSEPQRFIQCKLCGVLPDWHRYENYKAEVSYLQCPKCGLHTKGYYEDSFAVEDWYSKNSE